MNRGLRSEIYKSFYAYEVCTYTLGCSREKSNSVKNVMHVDDTMLPSERSTKFTLRIFAKLTFCTIANTAPIFFQRGIANIDTMEISCLSVESCGDAEEGFIIGLFEIDETLLPAFYERELEFRHVWGFPWVDIKIIKL
ncbi:hypothetical protein BC937DRAFT_94910 [Endogone sp. FLAS-F59071]|nr:hypothetical protein BC937DRAFT_94910 [Endogone sp. FLAS-F59071]|eukprot:RUS20573.1 hypothetical protein BC937DRAFT_94910 [Endogone sp. FLAS-F59071]